MYFFINYSVASSQSFISPGGGQKFQLTTATHCKHWRLAAIFENRESSFVGHAERKVCHWDGLKARQLILLGKNLPVTCDRFCYRGIVDKTRVHDDRYLPIAMVQCKHGCVRNENADAESVYREMLSAFVFIDAITSGLAVSDRYMCRKRS